MTRHILVSLNTKSINARTGENLGIRYIKSYVQGHGFDIDILENQFANKTVSELIAYLDNYDVIGFSLNYHGQVAVLKEILHQINENNKLIYIGGHFATICHEKLLSDNPKITFVMLSDGEFATWELIKNNYDYKHCHNTAYRFDNSIIKNEITISEDLDTMPFPYRDNNSFYLGDKHFSMITSRGCYYRCAYCSVGAYTAAYFKGHVRFRSAENIYEEIDELISRYGIKYITFQDDLFIGADLASRNRAIRLANLLLNNSISVYFSIQCSVKSVDFEAFSLLYKAGLRNVMIGIENFNEHALLCYNKRQTSEDIERAIGILRKIGVQISFGFILFYPEMDYNEILHNVEMLYKFDLINIRAITSILQIYPGTEYDDRELMRISSRNGEYHKGYTFKDKRITDYIDECRRFGRKYQYIENKLKRIVFLSYSIQKLDRTLIAELSSRYRLYLYQFSKDTYYRILNCQPISTSWSNQIDDMFQELDNDAEKMLSLL